jgi:hypothetical protein
MNVVDEFYPEKILKLYYSNQLDRLIRMYKSKWKTGYSEETYNTSKAIDYESIYMQQNTSYNETGDIAIMIADLRLHAERRYKHLLKAKKAIKRLLDGLNERQRNMLDNYFEYGDELEELYISQVGYKQGRKDYKEAKKVLRKACNELDKMLL